MSEPNLSLAETSELQRPIEVFVVQPRRPRYWLHALLLVATVVTTLIVGARLQSNFDRNLPSFAIEADFFPLMWAFEQPSRLLLGVPFSLALMLILLAHEMGHYFYCLRYGVRATLPYFIPAPTLIGTLGAFIRIKSRIPSRKALFDIAIAGPVAGFVLAGVTLAIGMSLSKAAPGVAGQSQIQFGYPLIFDLVWSALPMPNTIPVSALYYHPVALAAWVGMFATALNLLPGGQLDGGHIIYAVSPRAHRWVSRLTVLVLVPLGVFFWVGWLVWAAVLMATGMRHPQVPTWPDLGPHRRLMATAGLLILFVTFLPAPFADAALGWAWK